MSNNIQIKTQQTSPSIYNSFYKETPKQEHNSFISNSMYQPGNLRYYKYGESTQTPEEQNPDLIHQNNFSINKAYSNSPYVA